MSDPLSVLLGLRGTSSPDDLKRFGFECAGRWIRKEGSLNDAVTDVVREHRLNPEQTRRVVEFANHAAFGHLFEKQGSDKTIDFPVADAKVVLAAFAAAPDAPKSVPIDSACGHVAGSEGVRDLISELFGTPSTEKTASADPFGELKRTWLGLVDARNHAAAELDWETSLCKEAGDRFCKSFEQTVLSGEATVAELSHALHQTAGEGFVKSAVLAATEPMIRKNSMTPTRIGTVKTAGARVNREHPVVSSFLTSCAAATKVATLSRAVKDMDAQISRMTPYVTKTAAPAWLSKALVNARLAKEVVKEVAPTSIGGRSIREAAEEGLNAQRGMGLPGINIPLDPEKVVERMDLLRKMHVTPETSLEATGFGKGVGTSAALLGGMGAAHGIGEMMEGADEKMTRRKALAKTMAEYPDLERLDPKARDRAYSALWKFAPRVAAEPTTAYNFMNAAAQRNDVGIDAKTLKDAVELQKAYGESRASKGLLPSAVRTLALASGFGSGD